MRPLAIVCFCSTFIQWTLPRSPTGWQTLLTLPESSLTWTVSKLSQHLGLCSVGLTPTETHSLSWASCLWGFTPSSRHLLVIPGGTPGYGPEKLTMQKDNGCTIRENRTPNTHLH